MSLTLDEVKHIANLARIKLTPEEIEDYRSQLSAILDNFERLKQLDTRNIIPITGDFHTQIEIRADKPAPGLLLKDLMRNAADFDEDQFCVPPVFE